MNDYIEFLGIIDGIKTCLNNHDVAGAFELLEVAKEFYNLKILTFEEDEGKAQ